jgi:hypothetical protein
VTILHHTAILILVAVIAFPVALIMLAQLAALSKRPCLRKTESVDLYMICQRLPLQHDAPNRRSEIVRTNNNVPLVTLRNRER